MENLLLQTTFYKIKLRFFLKYEKKIFEEFLYQAGHK